jgi:hypothetical protein
MIDHTAIAAGESLRAEIAVLMAAYEAEHGPVETKPIVPRLEQKRPSYNRGVAAQPKPAKPPAPAKGGGSYDWHKAKRRHSVEQIAPLLREGMQLKVIAERTGLSVRTVSRIANSGELAA